MNIWQIYFFLILFVVFDNFIKYKTVKGFYLKGGAMDNLSTWFQHRNWNFQALLVWYELFVIELKISAELNHKRSSEDQYFVMSLFQNTYIILYHPLPLPQSRGRLWIWANLENYKHNNMRCIWIQPSLE